MSLFNSLNRLTTTLAGMMQTRLELMAVELEEELLRFARYFVYSLVTLFCAGMAVALGVFMIIALFWDEHRIAVFVTLIGFFGGLSIALAAWLRHQFLNKPRLLEYTINEFKKDTGLIPANDPAKRGEPS